MKKTSRRKGFTLIEILVVIMIIMLLATFLIAGLWPQQDRAYRAATNALLEQCKTALDEYFNEFHDYPPDGYDIEPGWVDAGGVALCTGAGIKLGQPGATRLYMGSGCLIYFLCHPVVNVQIHGADGAIDARDVSKRSVGPFLKIAKQDQCSVWAWDKDFDLAIDPGKPQFKTGWEVCELVDAYGWPIHYDKVKDLTGPLAAIFFQPDRFTGTTAGKGDLSHSDQTYFTTFVAGRFTGTDNVCPNGNGVDLGGGTSVSSHDQWTSGTASSGIPHNDPRSVPEPDGCIIKSSATNAPGPSPRNVNGYDLWSHGRSFTNGRYSMTNWKQ